ncbi:MAG TPA: hypothetical protein VFK10_02140 [Burkholderiaceae bacterium]|nr:hypothetical protein [Burkholderiaceae bacterium]
MKPASLRPYIRLWGLRGAWALAVALWALALVPWFKSPDARQLLPSPAAAGTHSNEAAVSQPLVVAEPVERPEPEATNARGIGTPEAVAPPAERSTRDSVVCGLGDGAGAPADAAAAQRSSHVSRQASLGLQQAFEALRLRSESAAQAAAWWLRVLVAREGSGDAQPAPCAPGADCAAATPWPTVSVAIDTLAQVAQSNSDAWVQQIAQRACDGATASAPCASLGTRRWSALEPDNAAAWLELAARDPQAIDEALFHLGAASRFDHHRGRLAAWVLQATPETLPPMQRYAAWQRSDELERASDARALAAAARACSDSARRDANRDQLCDGAQRWLAQTSRPAPPAEGAAAAAGRALDCATVERQWREARDSARRGTLVTAATAQR